MRRIVLAALCAAICLAPLCAFCESLLPQPDASPTPAPTQPPCEHVYDVWNEFVAETVSLNDDPYLCYMTMTVSRRVCVFCGGFDYDIQWELHPHLPGKYCPTCRHGFASPFQIMPLPIVPEA